MKSFLIICALFISFTQAQALPVHQNINFLEAAELFKDNANYNFLGIVKLSNCSGALVRFEQSLDSDEALVLSNGHCVEMGMFGGMMKPNEFVSHQKNSRKFQFLKADGSLMSGSVNAKEVLYATMTGTDLSLYTVNATYAEIEKKFGVKALILDSKHPMAGDEIDILSGYWQRGYSCTIDQFVFSLQEAGYEAKDSIRYSKEGCKTIHGTSGSPILSHQTGKVIGVNNTGNDKGEKCTMDNPCEVSADGSIFYQQGLSYGQQTYQIYTCLDLNRKLDLTIPGCQLFH